MVFRTFKRCFDLFSATILLIIASPLFILLMLAVRFNLGSPVFFKQERTGKNRKRFDLIKFRTMTNECDSDGNLLPDEMRQTKFGSFLRASSLDELPELICIIRGDMSVIGPRPLPPLYDSFYRESELCRFDVRGGLIPPDSVDSKTVISWDKQFEYESSYAKQLSFVNDVIIFLNVFKIIFKRSQSNYGNYVREPLNVERRDIKNSGTHSTHN